MINVEFFFSFWRSNCHKYGLCRKCSAVVLNYSLVRIKYVEVCWYKKMTSMFYHILYDIS